MRDRVGHGDDQFRGDRHMASPRVPRRMDRALTGARLPFAKLAPGFKWVVPARSRSGPLVIVDGRRLAGLMTEMWYEGGEFEDFLVIVTNGDYFDLSI